MDSKLILIELIEKYRDVLHSNRDYIVCNQLLSKISALMITDYSDNVKLELDGINSITSEEITMFSSLECERIISSLKVISKKKGWRVETVLGLIKKLRQDILDNKMKKFQKENDSLDELSRIVDEGLYKDNYDLLLDFIKTSVDNNMLSMVDAINLNFYILKECNNNSSIKEYEDVLETVELQENTESKEDVRKKLQEVFSKYGYVYDGKRLGDLDSKFLKYADVSYVDYILSKFKEYNISSDLLYFRRRALYNIIIDNDRETFDSILSFIDKNECSLDTLLGIPAVFAKRRRNYIEKNDDNSETNDNVFEICGAYQDFIDNIELYKGLANVSVIKDSDLNKLGRFLCTPSVLINKNLLLLQKYGIVPKGKLPKAIISLCGNNTEYIIDRMIEAGLHEAYLNSRITSDGSIKEPRGTYFLDIANNPFVFYKMKRANDFGHSILASNGGIRKVFKDNNESYFGIYLKKDDFGKSVIVQDSLPLERISNIDPKLRKSLPEIIQRQISNGEYSEGVIEKLYFNNLYKYTTYSAVEVFAASDKSSITSLKGDRVEGVFKEDYKRVITDEEMRSLTMDYFIKLLDNAVYCDSDGNSWQLKTTDLKYEFSHPNFPNINIVISRYKVLRLCKLLKENGCWINQDSSNIDKENTLLSVILKDTIISDTEMIALRVAIREILANGLIKVPKVECKDRRGAR